MTRGIKRQQWTTGGNDGTDSDDFLGSNTGELNFGSKGLDQPVNVKVNSTFGGEQTVAFWDPNNVVAGGPAFDLRPGEAVFLPTQIFMEQTMKLETAENFIASSVNFELNNINAATLRRFLISTSDAGTFGNYQFVLGSGAQQNQQLMAGPFDFIYTQSGADQAMHWDFNVGGTPDTRLMSVDASDAVDSVPKVSILAHLEVGEANIPYIDGLGVLEMTPNINDIPGPNPQATAMNVAPTMEYTSFLSNVFASLRGMNITPTFRPATGLGAGTDTANVSGALMAATWDGSNSPGRTITSVTGFNAQAAVRGGTASLVLGVSAQAGTVLGGATATEAISVRAGAPFEFLGGVIVTGTSLLSVGGTSAGTNFNAGFTNSAVPSYFEGFVSIGTAVAPTVELDVFGDVRVSGATELDGDLNHDGTLVGLYGVAPVAQTAAYTPTNVSASRSFDANSVTLNQLADVVGTMIADIQALGPFG